MRVEPIAADLAVALVVDPAATVRRQSDRLMRDGVLCTCVGRGNTISM